ncbi:hypothetical protein ACFU3O_13825 [Streptomyces antibioticus]|uniref:hypothetical protein n=1 Tax=Streptomyces antibioticus TaxID=1890 RepID=UPI003683A043
MCEAARIREEDEPAVADCMFTLHEAALLARAAADLAARPAVCRTPRTTTPTRPRAHLHRTGAEPLAEAVADLPCYGP